MVAVLVVVAVARLRLLNFPLERDEGEYAYAGQLMLQGIPPYQLAYNMKFPGTYAAYAAIMALFGQTPAGIHFGVLCLTTLTALMLFWLGKQILDWTAGMVAATSYAVMAASPAMLGLAGHATHFAAFFATAGLCVVWKARQNANWLIGVHRRFTVRCQRFNETTCRVHWFVGGDCFYRSTGSPNPIATGQTVLAGRGVWRGNDFAVQRLLFDSLARGGF